MIIRYTAILATTALLLSACGGGAPPAPSIATPRLASSSDIADAERFESIEGRANVYIGMNTRGVNWSAGMVEIKGSRDYIEVGSVYPRWYQNFEATPGQYRMRIRFDDSVGEYILSEFDLILEEGAVAYIECSGSLGSIRWIRDDGDVLRRFEDACPAGITQDNGIGACEVPYDNDVSSLSAILNEGEYMGACLLVDDPDVYEGFNLAAARTNFVVNEEYELAIARDADSLESWQEFLTLDPSQQNREEAEIRIAELETEQAYMAWESEIQTILKRDSVLPLQAQRDKYMIALTGYLQTQDFEPSLLYFELLDRMNIEQSDSITHFWGEALLRTGDPQGALGKFYEYINATGSSGTYYRDALALINESEAALAAQEEQEAARAIEVVNAADTADGDFSGYVEVTNSTGYDIWYLYVSHSDSDSWGDDVLGSEILYSGESFRVDLDDYPSSVFDIRAEDEDEDTYTFYSIDVAAQDLTITLSDLD